VEHTHSFNYAANGNVITATCTSTTGTCDLTNKQATLTLNAPAHTLYGDGKNANATFTGEIPGVTNPTINYSRSDTPLSSAPTDAGSYTARCQLGTVTARVEYTINKATNTGWSTTPHAVANLVYTGQPQALITAGAASAGNVLYTVGTDPDNEPDDTAGGRPYTSSVPEMTNAGTYYVWCKIDGGKNYTSINAQKVEVKIAKANITPTVSLEGWTYGEDAKTPSVDGNTGNGTVTYTYKVKDADDSTYSATVPTNAGDYTVKATVAESANYNGGEATKNFTIAKKAATITADAKSKTYGDADPELTATVEGTVGSDTLNYTLNRAEGNNFGEYDITVTLGENPNYDITTTGAKFTINKKAVTIKAKDQSIYVGGNVPTLEGADFYTVTGLVGEDTLTTAPTLNYQKDGNAASPVNTTAGTYDIVPSSAAAGDNYEITYQNGTLTISRRPSSGGGGSSAGTTITVPVSGDSASVSVSASVSGTTATVKAPTTAQLNKVIGESVKTGDVTIDVSGLNKDIATVSIPTETVKAIEKAVSDPDNDASALTVKLTDGSVTFDAAALAAIAQQAKGSTIQLNLDSVGESKLKSAQKTAIKDMDVQAVYDAYLTSNGQRISDFKGGKATVTISYTLKDGQTGRGVAVWYVAEDGEKAEVPTTYNNKTVSFTAEHFSNYVIAYDAEHAVACPKDDTCPMSAFTDLNKNSWYHDGVHFALDNGVMSGYGSGKFGPNDLTSRAMIAQILWNMEGKPVVNYAMSYTDVGAGAWYAEAVRWATAQGIMAGYGHNKFGPNDDVTREQLVTIMYRYAQMKKVDVSVGEDTNILSYDDAFDVSEWAIPAMQWAVGAEIVNGTSASTISPKNNASRAEIATIVMRYCEKNAK
jgi:hypothetical protein